MNDIKGRQLIITMGAVFGALLVITLINNGLSATMGPDLSGVDITNLDPLDPALQTNPIVTLFSCLATLCTGALYIGAGMLYAYLHTKEAHLETQDAAIAGAVAAAVPAALNSVVSSGLSFLINGELVTQVLDQMPPELLGNGGGLMAGVGIFAVLAALCCTGLIAALLGAVGGAIGTSVFGKKG